MKTLAFEPITQIGVCVKALDGTVQFQNEACIKICGDQLGLRCKTGCMLHCNAAAQESASLFDRCFSLVKNIESAKHHIDALIVNDGKNLTSFLYEKDDLVRYQLEALKKYNLSKSELRVLEKLLYGFNNRQIAKELCICKQTLRTHLNNIYKKFPAEIRNKILSIHAH